MSLILLWGICLMGMAGGLFFAVKSFREAEPRAPRVGLGTAGVFLFTGLIAGGLPGLRLPMILAFGVLGAFLAVFFIPFGPNPKAVKGASGHVVGTVTRFDERDIVFARNRSLPVDSKIYREYYLKHPEKEPGDARRRKKGGPVGRIGSIDGAFRPHVAMAEACFEMPPIFGPYAVGDPGNPRPSETLPPVKAAALVKGFALYLGADLVGICPFSRPHHSYHRLARRLIRHSPLAQTIFPFLDNRVYGKRWRSRRAAPWIDFGHQTPFP